VRASRSLYSCRALTTGAPTEPTTALGHAPGTRAGCGPMQTACRPTALRSVRLLGRSQAGRTASHLVGRVQACPLTSAQSGIAVCDRPHVLDYLCLLWAMLATRLPTTAPAARRNGVDTHLVRCSQPGGPASSPSARPSRAPCSHTRTPRRSGHRPCPAIHVAGQVWPPIALALNHRSVREPGPLLPLS
jgi:hypothetical protein